MLVLGGPQQLCFGLELVGDVVIASTHNLCATDTKLPPIGRAVSTHMGIFDGKITAVITFRTQFTGWKGRCIAAGFECIIAAALSLHKMMQYTMCVGLDHAVMYNRNTNCIRWCSRHQ